MVDPWEGACVESAEEEGEEEEARPLHIVVAVQLEPAPSVHSVQV